MAADRSEDELGIVHTWGAGPEVVFLSNLLADPVRWFAPVRDELLELGYRVTTFEHRPEGVAGRSAVGSVVEFLTRRREPVALVGWSQGHYRTGAQVSVETLLGAVSPVPGSPPCLGTLGIGPGTSGVRA